jgi:5-amino-6-(5-phosphoribosylamino)uracil reductase
MDKLRAQADAVLIGAGTLKADGFPLLVRTPEVRRRRTGRGLDPHPVNVLLSRSLAIPVRRKFFSHPGTRKLVYTTRSAPAKKQSRLAKYAEVITVSGRDSFLKQVMANLSGRGIKKLLVEGGGELNFAFFQAGLVNELYLTVTPRIIGGEGAPTVVDGRGFLKHNHIKLHLRSVKRIGSELFLRYLVGSTGG